jgi:hypothetical protein
MKEAEKMTVFWVVVPCILVDVHTHLRLHGATTHKTPIFILAIMRTNLKSNKEAEVPYMLW